MAARALIWRLIPGYLVIIIGTLLFLLIVLARREYANHVEQFGDELEASLQVLAPYVRDRLEAGVPGNFPAPGPGAELRLTVLSSNGSIVADSADPAAAGERVVAQPEVQAALRGQTGRRVQRGPGGAITVFVARPLDVTRPDLGVTRLAGPVERPVTTLALLPYFAAAALIAGALLVLSARYTASRIVKPLGAATSGIRALARGHWERDLPKPDVDELADLTAAVNETAATVDERLRSALRHRSEQEAVLASMVEGVFAVDLAERIISMNRAAGRLLGVNPEDASGRNVSEVVRNSALQEFVSRAIHAHGETETEFRLHGAGQQVIQAHGSVLRSAEDSAIGAVIVLNDITRLRRLEQVRKDFVSNVSHELKTPITSIKGFVETLLDGARHNTEDLERFLQIIQRHADRLNNIIEDLLTLSRIEQDERDAEDLLGLTTLRGPLAEAVQMCMPAAQAKNIRVELDCDRSLRARINAALLQQGIVNLIDNAIKYSDANGRVDVEAVEDGAELVIRVRDQGAGIAAEHLDRLFERFYRVDKARSRNMGGTGLGLAIVRHIVHAHNGRIDVESQLGRGSTFSIYLPRPHAEISVPEAVSDVNTGT